tara:strand:- start:6389 stop:7702 length:1314 start_codon:yes stop_codon:yes gene_type:complete
MSKGIELWNQAKQIIPGGNQILSKRVERFLPGLWPAYYTRAKGCEVWDMDGEKYFDFAQMGVGACSLGYADDDINREVIEAVNESSMCTLNCYEEVELAEKLIEIHPWADMVRYSRTGGEACAVAVRIARAATSKDIVAFCGYSGWHDWYISANLGNTSNLDGQLIPGLKPKGIARNLKNTAIPFSYNKLSDLINIVNEYPNQVGTIIMEPQREVDPEPGFLEGVRELATKIGAVLIFDEVTSGFRMNYGGIHLLRDINPDIAVFGKALGNGYPISVVIGKQDVMDSAQDSFISSTFWSERVGFVAALATLKKMKEKKVQESLIYYGEKINKGWKELAELHDLNIHIDGIPPLTHINFEYPNSLEIQTYYSQEMLDRNYLLGASIYTTYAYNDGIIEKFLSDTDDVFKKLKVAIDQNNVASKLRAEVIQSGFKRLTN